MRVGELKHCLQGYEAQQMNRHELEPLYCIERLLWWY